MERRAILRVGEIAHPAAQVVSKRRRWPIITVDSFDHAAAAIFRERLSTAVVIADHKALSIAACLQFSTELAQSEACPGASFLLGDSSSDLIERARRFPSSARIEVNSLSQAVLCHNDFRSFVADVSLRDLSANSEQDSHHLSALARDDFSVLYLIGHSNGLDEGLHRIAICRRDDSSVIPPADFKAFPCYYGAPCRFESAEFTAFPTEAIAARKLVNLCCNGVTLQDYVFSPKVTIGDGLMNSTAMESMISTIGVSSIDKSDFLILYYLISDGLSFGEVTTRANQFRLQRGKRADLFCFGDPEGALSCAQRQIECQWCGEFGETGSLDLSSSSEIKISFPKHIIQDNKVVLVAPEADDVRCGLSAAGSVFLSCSPNAASNGIKLRLLTVEDGEIDMLSSSRQLAEHFEFVAHLARSVLATAQRYAVTGTNKLLLALAECAVTGANKLLSALAELRKCLQEWPFYAVYGGDVLRGVRIAEAFANLSSQLDGVGNAFTEMYLSVSSHFSFLMNPDEIGTSRALQSAGHVCGYCGQPVDETMLLSYVEQPLRLLGCCYYCGLVYDICIGGEKWLSAKSIYSGTTNEFTISVSNPYEFPATGFGVLAVGPFGSQQGIACTTRALLMPGQTQTVRFELEVPPDFFSGTYYARACIIIGTSIYLYYRPFIVRGNPQ